MTDEKKELVTAGQVLARLAGGGLAAVSVAVLGPGLTLLVGAAITALIISQVASDSKDENEKKK